MDSFQLLSCKKSLLPGKINNIQILRSLRIPCFSWRLCHLAQKWILKRWTCMAWEKRSSIHTMSTFFSAHIIYLAKYRIISLIQTKCKTCNSKMPKCNKCNRNKDNSNSNLDNNNQLWLLKFGRKWRQSNKTTTRHKWPNSNSNSNRRWLLKSGLKWHQNNKTTLDSNRHNSNHHSNNKRKYHLLSNLPVLINPETFQLIKDDFWKIE